MSLCLAFHPLGICVAALFNLSLNYCLLGMLVANMYLFTVHFLIPAGFFPFPFFISVLFILIMHDQFFFKFKQYRKKSPLIFHSSEITTVDSLVCLLRDF